MRPTQASDTAGSRAQPTGTSVGAGAGDLCDDRAVQVRRADTNEADAIATAFLPDGCLLSPGQGLGAAPQCREMSLEHASRSVVMRPRFQRLLAIGA